MRHCIRGVRPRVTHKKSSQNVRSQATIILATSPQQYCMMAKNNKKENWIIDHQHSSHTNFNYACLACISCYCSHRLGPKPLPSSGKTKKKGKERKEDLYHHMQRAVLRYLLLLLLCDPIQFSYIFSRPLSPLYTNFTYSGQMPSLHPWLWRPPTNHTLSSSAGSMTME